MNLLSKKLECKVVNVYNKSVIIKGEISNVYCCSSFWNIGYNIKCTVNANETEKAYDYYVYVSKFIFCIEFYIITKL